jgi:hypothetical protein
MSAINAPGYRREAGPAVRTAKKNEIKALNYEVAIN